MTVKQKSTMFFASAKPGRMDRDQTLPARFEKLCAKDPFLQIKALEKLRAGTSCYRIRTIK